jgi:hypothetical protein
MEKIVIPAKAGIQYLAEKTGSPFPPTVGALSTGMTAKDTGKDFCSLLDKGEDFIRNDIFFIALWSSMSTPQA